MGRAPRPVVSKAPSSLPQAGELVGGKYRLQARIAKGGMASVWIAHNEALDVEVAVKFIRADLTGPRDDRLADRLLQEARATAQLGHPAIVRVHDFGKTPRGVPYLVMEMLEGESLDMALGRRGRVSGTKAVQALMPIAHALACAHDKGIIHRDLKPENVYLAQTAGKRIQPKLIDFGISRTRSKGAKRLTFAGEALGTPAYMSPEQARGEDADHRSDIWAFCVMLYELVTGRLPFEGKSISAMARSIIQDRPSPITAYSAGDEHLWDILERGLRKAPADRWPSMRDLGSELACWLIDRGIREDVAGARLEAAWLQQWPASERRNVFDSAPPPGRPLASASRAPSAEAISVRPLGAQEDPDADPGFVERTTLPAARAPRQPDLTLPSTESAQPDPLEWNEASVTMPGAVDGEGQTIAAIAEQPAARSPADAAGSARPSEKSPRAPARRSATGDWLAALAIVLVLAALVGWFIIR